MLNLTPAPGPPPLATLPPPTPALSPTPPTRRRPLLGGDLLQGLLGREARVRPALAEQFPGVGQVRIRAPGLGVRPVAAGLVVLVGADGEVRERLGELLGRALGDAGLVGVLEA